MRDELLNFDIFPSVVPADKVTNVKIKAKTEYLNFIDEVKYYVSVCPMEIHDIPINDEFTLDGYKYKEFELYPKDGVVVERQTRHFEGVVGEIPCGFKSHRPHQH